MLTRLPIPASPARHETLISYLTRLAALHGLPPEELWQQLSMPRPGSRRRIVLADRLALVTGRPAEHLARALPELRHPPPDWTLWRHQPQPGCLRCDARHDGGPVLRLLPHHRYVCTEHRYWIGPPDDGQPATPLDSRLDEVAGEIVLAQHQHRRLVARHGHAAAYDAVLTGFLICGHLWDSRAPESTGAWRHWMRRADRLIPPDSETTTYSTSRLFAAVYPEAVSLAVLVASPAWRQLASGDTRQQRTFLSEACRRLGRNADEDDHDNDVIRHWMIFDSHHPPSRPDKTFPDTRDHGATRHTKPSPASHDRTRRSAYWFTVNRRGGTGILHHRHIQSVLRREWAPTMDGIRATIYASGSLTDLSHGYQRKQPKPSEIAE